MTMPTYSMTHLRSISFLLMSGLVACSDSDSGPPLVVQRDSAGIEIVEAMRPLWGDSSLWSIDPDPLVDLALSGSGPPHEFHLARSMKQRPDGSLVLADGGSDEVRVFSATGEFQGAFGGPGEGPAEFRNLQRVEDAGDMLLALDSDGSVTLVAPDLTLVRTFSPSPTTSGLHYLGGGTVLAILREPLSSALGNAADEVVRPAEALVLFDLEGMRIDSIGEMSGPGTYVTANQARTPPLFDRSSHVAVLEERVFRGSADMMQVEELEMSGSLARIRRIPGFPLELSDARIAAERNARLDLVPAAMPPFIRQMVEDLPAPATRPAYAAMLVDPSGAVWLQLHRGTSEQGQPQEWLVLDAGGTWLGNVRVPDRFTVTDITMETVLGVWRDELDVDHPQVLRLTRN